MSTAAAVHKVYQKVRSNPDAAKLLESLLVFSFFVYVFALARIVLQSPCLSVCVDSPFPKLLLSSVC